MRVLRAVLLAMGATTLIGAGGRLAGRLAYDRFDHWQHRRVFPMCQGCHAGAQDSTRSIWPGASDCANCHDGTIQRKIDWSPPTGPRPTNLRFNHLVHTRKAAERLPRDSVGCTSCHLAQGAPWMRVRRTEVRRCLACHDVAAEHLAATNTACRTCHLTLPEATALPRERIARFPTPPSHFDASFPLAHGKLAQPPPADGGTPVGISPSCATCHARDFCITCHVNAPEVPAIQALAPDPRSLAIETKLEAPRRPRRPGVHPAARPGGAPRAAELCRLSYPRELSHLSRGPTGDRGRDARRRARAGQGRVGETPSARVPRRRFHRPARAGRIGGTQELHRVPCARGLSRLSSPQRRLGAGIPPRRVPLPPSCVGIRAGDHVRGVPQHRRLLHRLSPAGGAGVARAASRWLPRREAEIPPGARPSGTPEPGELRLVPRRARLPDVPLRPGRPALQSAWPGVRRRAARRRNPQMCTVCHGSTIPEQ